MTDKPPCNQTTESTRRLTTSLPGAGDDRQDRGSDVGGACSQTTLPREAIEAALNWRERHWQHVVRLETFAPDGVAPSGSDVWHPELWKDIHWRWLRESV